MRHCIHGHEMNEENTYHRPNSNKKGCRICRHLRVNEYKARIADSHKKKLAKAHRDKRNFGGNREKAIERDSYKCVKCGMTRQEHIDNYGEDITVDHIDKNGRYSKVKNHDLNNLQTLCLPCHLKKDAKLRKELKQSCPKKES